MPKPKLLPELGSIPLQENIRFLTLHHINKKTSHLYSLFFLGDLTGCFGIFFQILDQTGLLFKALKDWIKHCAKTFGYCFKFTTIHSKCSLR